MSGKHDRASELRAIADGRLMLNVRNGVTVSRSMLAMIADEIDALQADVRLAVQPNGTAVCLGGRWKGWLFRKHPDGTWVSDHPLELVDPHENNPFAARRALEGGE